MIKIRVPATSANLGPGFDTVGIAMQLYATFLVEESTSLIITGCPPAYANEHNLFYKSYLHRCAELNVKASPLNIAIQSDIPVARGLGSSATFIIGGIVCAHLLHQIPYTFEEIALAAAKEEGHPDNVCPALYGGLCTSLIAEGKVFTEHFPIHKELHFYFVVPDFELLTTLTRVALPVKVLLTEAVHNLSRLPLLLKGLEKGKQDLIDVCIQDTLHHPYRYPLIYQSESVLSILESFGIKSAYISGAGPTIGFILNHPVDVLAIQAKLNGLRHEFKLIELAVETHGLKVEV